MSSFIRRIQRKSIRAAKAYLVSAGLVKADSKEQVMQFLPNGGYRTLHPTRGWRYVSPRRAALYGLT